MTEEIIVDKILYVNIGIEFILQGLYLYLGNEINLLTLLQQRLA